MKWVTQLKNNKQHQKTKTSHSTLILILIIDIGALLSILIKKKHNKKNFNKQFRKGIKINALFQFHYKILCVIIKARGVI